MRYNRSKTGMIKWHDLTVENAEEVSLFYANVVGWKPENVAVEDYHDFNMVDAVSGESMAGVCHKKGANAGLPSQWLMYIIVENIQEAVQRTIKHKGKVIKKVTDLGSGKFAVIQDPAGAVFALFQEPA